MNIKFKNISVVVLSIWVLLSHVSGGYAIYVDSADDRKTISTTIRGRIHAHVDALKDFKDSIEGDTDLLPCKASIDNNLETFQCLELEVQKFSRGELRSDSLFATMAGTRLTALAKRWDSKRKALESEKGSGRGPIFHVPSTYMDPSCDPDSLETIIAKIAIDLHDVFLDSMTALFPILNLMEIGFSGQRAILTSPSIWKDLQAASTPTTDSIYFPQRAYLGGLGFRICAAKSSFPDPVGLHPDLVLDKYDDRQLFCDYVKTEIHAEETNWAGFHKFQRPVIYSKYVAQQKGVGGVRGIPDLPPFQTFLDFMGIPRDQVHQPVVQDHRKSMATESQSPDAMSAHDFPLKEPVIKLKAAEGSLYLGPPLSEKKMATIELPEGLPVCDISPDRSVIAEKTRGGRSQEARESEQYLELPDTKGASAQPESHYAERVRDSGEDDRSSGVKRRIFTSRQQGLLADIFGHSGRFVPVAYDAFVQLWESEAIGGKVLSRNSGGSHRSLVLQDQVIGKTFQPHGKGKPTFGKRMIKTLRSALESIGVTPSSFA